MFTKQMDTLVAAVKAHAVEHCEDGGWDVIVECWTDAEIAEYLSDTGYSTPEQAVKLFTRLAGIWAERQADARNSAF